MRDPTREGNDGEIKHRTGTNTTARVVIGSTLFAIGQVASTIVFALLTLLIWFFPYRVRYAFITQWTRFNLWWLRVTCGLSHEVVGLQNIPDKACIVLCKHESAWETLALQLYFSPQCWVLKRELLWLPFFGWGLAALKPIAIDRKAARTAMEQVVEQGRARLEAGRWVVIFPEGTRVAPGERRRFRVGGAALASRTGFAIVPVTHNAGDYWPRNSFLKHPGTIRLVIGKTIESKGLKPDEINKRAQAWIHDKGQELRLP